MAQKRSRRDECASKARGPKRVKVANPPVDLPRDTATPCSLTATPITSQDKPFRFLSLPPELRNDICELCLPNSTTVHISSTPAEGNTNNALLLTCRQIYNEAITLLYKKNSFVLTETFECKDKRSVPLHFLEHNVGDANVGLIKDLTVDWAKNLSDFLSRHGNVDDIIAHSNESSSGMWDLHPLGYGKRAEELRCSFPRYRNLEVNIKKTLNRVQGFSQLTSLTILTPGCRGFETAMDNTYHDFCTRKDHVLWHCLRWLRNVRKLKIGYTVAFGLYLLAEEMGVDELDIVWGQEDYNMWMKVIAVFGDVPTVAKLQAAGWQFHEHGGLPLGGVKKLWKKGEKELLEGQKGDFAPQLKEI